MPCNILQKNNEKKEVFLYPSSLTGSAKVSFMCSIHPLRPPGSINCLLQWLSIQHYWTLCQQLIERNSIFDFVVFDIMCQAHRGISITWAMAEYLFVCFLLQEMSPLTSEDKHCNRWDIIQQGFILICCWVLSPSADLLLTLCVCSMSKLSKGIRSVTFLKGLKVWP